MGKTLWDGLGVMLSWRQAMWPCFTTRLSSRAARGSEGQKSCSKRVRKYHRLHNELVFDTPRSQQTSPPESQNFMVYLLSGFFYWMHHKLTHTEVRVLHKVTVFHMSATMLGSWWSFTPVGELQKTCAKSTVPLHEPHISKSDLKDNKRLLNISHRGTFDLKWVFGFVKQPLPAGDANNSTERHSHLKQWRSMVLFSNFVSEEITMWSQDWLILCLFWLPMGLAQKFEASDLSEFPIDIPNNTREIVIKGEDCFLVHKASIGGYVGSSFCCSFHMSPQSEPKYSCHLRVTEQSWQDLGRISECDIGLLQTDSCMKLSKRNTNSLMFVPLFQLGRSRVFQPPVCITSLLFVN